MNMDISNFTGIGLRTKHLQYVIDNKPDIGWFEIHSENYCLLTGIEFEILQEIRKSYPISMHGIAMSLGSASGVDINHIKQVKKLADLINPIFISEHLSWSSTKDKFVPDLLPIPLTEEALEIFCKNLSIAQDILQREILIENPSSYFEYDSSIYKEYDFLNIITEKTGAQILLDINNIYVSSINHNWCPREYIDNINLKAVKEIHLAGHSKHQLENGKFIVIDTHNNLICDEVWNLYEYIIEKLGPIPTLIEWDLDIPEFDVLMSEAKKAKFFIDKIKKEKLINA